MEFSKLVRDPEMIKSHLHELKNGSVVCDQEMKIYIPERYIDKNMAYVGSDNHILGIYCITTEDKYYGVSLVNAMIPIDPSSTNRVKVDEEVYIEFVFDKGSTVFKSTDLVKTATLVYYIFDEFFAKGNIPWYIGYEELGKIFDTAKYHAGANVGQNQEITQLITSLVARTPEDRTKYYRSSLNTMTDLNTKKIAYVSLRSVEYSATNTLNKLGGNYMAKGITSALIDKTTRVERLESLLTS